jgi:O-antigen ligase
VTAITKKQLPRGRSTSFWVIPHPLVSLRGLLLLFPLWWVLGIEQFIWPLGLMIIAILGASRKDYRLLIPPFAKWLLLFIGIYILSGIAIEEPIRLLTFTRTLGAYLSLFFLLIICANFVRSWQDTKAILHAFSIMIAVAVVAGTFAIADLWRPSFTSTIGLILPDWIASSSYGGQIALRRLGYPSWFTVIGAYYRVSSLFLFPTMYASALAVSLPIIIYLWGITKTYRSRIFYAALALLLAFNFLFTTGRIAIVGFILGGGFHILFHTRWRPLLRLIMLSILLLGLTMSIYDLLVTTSQSQLSITQWWENFVMARGPGSFNARSTVYQHTLNDFSQRPLLGWATERHIPDFPYPAGSHSYYLGILYKHGLIGFSIFLALLGSLIKHIQTPLLKLKQSNHFAMVKFMQYSQWAIIAIAINGFTDAVDLDTTTFTILSLIIVLAMQTRKQLIMTPKN